MNLLSALRVCVVSKSGLRSDFPSGVLNARESELSLPSKVLLVLSRNQTIIFASIALATACLATGGAVDLRWIVPACSAALVSVLFERGPSAGHARDRQSATAQAQSLSDADASLQLEAERNRLQFVEYSDQVMKRVGADLHDGPAQLIGLSLLRLDAGHAYAEMRAGTREAETSEIEGGELDATRQALRDALSEIRNLAHGLVLPEIEKLSLREAIELAVSKHEQRTGTAVELKLTELPGAAPSWLKRFVYRFAQEGLMNAYRHAGGVGQCLEVVQGGSALEVKVSDQGPGYVVPVRNEGRTSLGLAGLRERAGAIGAVIDIQSAPGVGTCMRTRIPFSAGREYSSVSEI